MPKSCVKGVDFRLRAGQPQPQRGCPTGNLTTGFVLQSFGGERRTTRTYKATTEVIESSDLIGLNPDAQFESATYQGTQYVSKDGELFLSGQEIEMVEYIREEDVPGVSTFEFI